jgi:hypothetical protein
MWSHVVLAGPGLGLLDEALAEGDAGVRQDGVDRAKAAEPDVKEGKLRLPRGDVASGVDGLAEGERRWTSADVPRDDPGYYCARPA